MANIELTTLANYAPNKVLKVVNGALAWATDDGNSSPSANVKIVQGGTGVEIGAPVNAADNALGALPGEIWVFGGGTITTPIIVGSFHTLKLHDGTYVCNGVDFGLGDGVPIQLKDNSSLEGASWNTIIVERPNTAAAPTSYRVVQAYRLRNQMPILPNKGVVGSLHNTDESFNISVKNIQFKGIKSNAHDGGNNAAVLLGNTNYGRVENCWFNEISGYGCQFGASPLAGFHPENCWYLNNLHTNLMSQNFAITSGVNIVVEGNIFKDPGKRPYAIKDATNASPIVVTLDEPHHLLHGQSAVIKGVGGNLAANGAFFVKIDSPTQVSLHTAYNANTGVVSGPVAGTGVFSGTAGELVVHASQGAAIDLEPNGDPSYNGEMLIGITIKNNIFDFRNMHTIFGAIAYQVVANGLRNEGGIIEGNVMLGNETGQGAATIGIKLSSPDTRDVIVANNYVYKFTQAGMVLKGTRIKVNNNQLIHCGGGGSGAIEAQDLEYSTIENNSVLFQFQTNRTGINVGPPFEMGNPYIFEKGMNRFNTWSNNICSRLQHQNAFGTGFNGGREWSATDSVYKNNRAVGINGGIDEAKNSNRNLFDGNITDSLAAGISLQIVGAQSKVISHKHTDGSIFMPRVVGSTPPAPTIGVVDDVANTFNWTNSIEFRAVSEYEFTTNGGTTYAPVTAKPITGLTGAIGINQVGVRVKAANGVNASAPLYNQTAYTV